MKYHLTIVLGLCLCFKVFCQNLPLKIEMPALSNDPSLQWIALHFDVMGKDKFSTLSYNAVFGSVLRSGEFVPDTGQIVYKDPKHQKPIDHSNIVILLKKQIVNGAGNLLASQEWLLAERELDATKEYKLYFAKGVKHPLVANRTVLTKSMYNIQPISELSEAEMASLKDLAEDIASESYQYGGEPEIKQNNGIEDILATRKKFKDLKSTGLLFRGNLPSSESVLTRYDIVSDRIFVITKVKEKDKTKPTQLKFYVTSDYQTFDCLDSTTVQGEVTLTSAATIYNTNTEAIGAFANLHVKSKDEKGEDASQQLSVAMDADYVVGTWLHSVGKNKLNSLSPEICWYEGSKLWVMSNNREKFFKSYVQMHLLEKGKPAISLFPLTEEEKGSEKTKFVKTFQPPPPNGVGVAPALPERYIPIYFTTAGETRYIVMQGTRIDETTKNRQYLSLNIYRIEGTGKVTNIDLLSDYKAFVPLPFPQIIKNTDAEFFLLPYPLKLQLAFYPDKSEISPLEVDNSFLVPKPINSSYITTSPYGSALLRRLSSGPKFTLLFYPKL